MVRRCCLSLSLDAAQPAPPTRSPLPSHPCSPPRPPGYNMGTTVVNDPASNASAGFAWLPPFLASLFYLCINAMTWKELDERFVQQPSTAKKARVFLLCILFVAMCAVVGAAYSAFLRRGAAGQPAPAPSNPARVAPSPQRALAGPLSPLNPPHSSSPAPTRLPLPGAQSWWTSSCACRRATSGRASPRSCPRSSSCCPPLSSDLPRSRPRHKL